MVGGRGRNPGGGDDREARRDRERAPDDRREDQRRPVPEVPRVGDAPDVADRREREQPGRGPLDLGVDRGSGEDQAGGAEGGQQSRGARERGARVEGDRRVDDRPEAGPADSGRRDAGDAHRAQQRQRRPERQLPGAAEGREVGGGGLLVGEVDAERERADQDERQRHPERGADRAAATAPEPGGRQQQGRPDDVELLLDRQRPEMQDGARFDFLGEVVDRLGGEMPVGRVEGRADDVARDFDRAHGGEEQEREGADGGEEDRRQRQQPLGAAGVEAAQRDAAGPVELAQQQPGDEEARDDEEDVDADIAAGEEGQARVAEEDGADRDGAHSLDIGAEAAFVGQGTLSGGGRLRRGRANRSHDSAIRAWMRSVWCPPWTTHRYTRLNFEEYALFIASGTTRSSRPWRISSGRRAGRRTGESLRLASGAFSADLFVVVGAVGVEGPFPAEEVGNRRLRQRRVNEPFAGQERGERASGRGAIGVDAAGVELARSVWPPPAPPGRRRACRRADRGGNGGRIPPGARAAGQRLEGRVFEEEGAAVDEEQVRVRARPPGRRGASKRGQPRGTRRAEQASRPAAPAWMLIHGGSFLYEDPTFESLTQPARAQGGVRPPLPALPARRHAGRLPGGPGGGGPLRARYGGAVYAYGSSAGGTLAALLAGDGLVSAAAREGAGLRPARLGVAPERLRP